MPALACNSRIAMTSGAVLWLLAASAAEAAPAGGKGDAAPDLSILSTRQWAEVDRSVERALAYLASQQRGDGSVPTESRGQPGVTSLAVMAFLSAGHAANSGPYARTLQRGVGYALDCQQFDGALALHPPGGFVRRYNADHTVFYNHGITGLMLGEAFGMTTAEQDARIDVAIPAAIEFLARHQLGKPLAGDNGGWRYWRPHTGIHADLSCTAWQLMLLRSAKNAGFDVPEEIIEHAIAYVERSYEARQGVFLYGLYGRERYPSGGAVGGAIVSLSMAGKHQSAMAQTAAQWLIKLPIERYDSSMAHVADFHNYHYGVYYASQASFQLGGAYWKSVYPRIVNALLANQRRDGSWPAESGIARPYGSNYTTSLAVLALTPPYQLLPIYQR